MQLEQSFDLPVPPAAAWPAFRDVGLLVECLPGAALTGPAADGELPLRFDVKLGPIAAAFVGSGRLSLDEASQGGRFEGTASDRRTSSRVKGAAAFGLVAQGGGTRVNLTIDYGLTGTLAQFSRGALVREIASALTAQFAANLARRVQATTTAAAPAAAATAPVATAAATASTAAPTTAPAAEAALTTAMAAAPVAQAAAATRAAPLDTRPLLALLIRSAWKRLLARMFHRNA